MLDNNEYLAHLPVNSIKDHYNTIKSRNEGNLCFFTNCYNEEIGSLLDAASTCDCDRHGSVPVVLLLDKISDGAIKRNAKK